MAGEPGDAPFRALHVSIAHSEECIEVAPRRPWRWSRRRDGCRGCNRRRLWRRSSRWGWRWWRRRRGLRVSEEAPPPERLTLVDLVDDKEQIRAVGVRAGVHERTLCGVAAEMQRASISISCEYSSKEGGMGSGCGGSRNARAAGKRARAPVARLGCLGSSARSRALGTGLPPDMPCSRPPYRACTHLQTTEQGSKSTVTAPLTRNNACEALRLVKARRQRRWQARTVPAGRDLRVVERLASAFGATRGSRTGRVGISGTARADLIRPCEGHRLIPVLANRALLAVARRAKELPVVSGPGEIREEGHVRRLS